MLYIECSSNFWNTEYHTQQPTFMLHVDENKVGLRLLIFFFNVYTSTSWWGPAVWMSESVHTYLAWLVVGCCKSRPSMQTAQGSVRSTMAPPPPPVRASVCLFSWEMRTWSVTIPQVVKRENKKHKRVNWGNRSQVIVKKTVRAWKKKPSSNLCGLQTIYCLIRPLPPRRA